MYQFSNCLAPTNNPKSVDKVDNVAMFRKNNGMLHLWAERQALEPPTDADETFYQNGIETIKRVRAGKAASLGISL